MKFETWYIHMFTNNNLDTFMNRGLHTPRGPPPLKIDKFFIYGTILLKFEEKKTFSFVYQ